MTDAARTHRIVILAATATVVYGAIVGVWPQHWRRDLIHLGGSWSLFLLIFGERHWQLSIRQVHERVQRGRLRVSRGETLLGLAGLGLLTLRDRRLFLIR